ncbi:MAG: aquaporin, partial [Candidatus Baltobacteraceae bacterium]
MLECALRLEEPADAARGGRIEATLGARRTAYAIEAACLGIFMFVAGSVAVGLRLVPPAVAAAFAAHALLYRLTFGTAMGLTTMAIVYSPWGRRSGAHINPAVTLTYALLGKIAPRDAAFYVLAQFGGAALGLALLATMVSAVLAQPSIHYVVT